jgi:hypothetical protein
MKHRSTNSRYLAQLQSGRQFRRCSRLVLEQGSALNSLTMF